MRSTLAIVGVAVASLGLLPAQQLRWQLGASQWPLEYKRMMPFADYNQDGYRDFLRAIAVGLVSYGTLQIASGLDGSTLWSMDNYYFHGPVACHAGDMNGDGWADLAILYDFSTAGRRIEMFSPHTGQVLWQVPGSHPGLFGNAMLGDLDVTGDGLPDFVTITGHPSESDIYVYGNSGALLYTLPCLLQGAMAVSLAKMGDINGDGRDDFVVGLADNTGSGQQWLISGTGAIIRATYGLQPGDLTAAHVSNLGDIDGDGVNDYAAWPMSTSLRHVAVAWSGQTGAVIHSWTDYGNSVVAGEDFDQDGVNDVVTGADWTITPPNLYGRTICRSGRDGTELWRIDNTPSTTGSNGSSGWMESSASLGVQPGSPYPVVAWMDIHWWTPGSSLGRIRAYDMARAGQGPVTGTPCASSGAPPRIGVRQTDTGSRITIARSYPGALAGLWMAYASQTSFFGRPLPIDMTAHGFPGCFLHVGPEASAFRVLGTTGIDRGYAAVDLPYSLPATLGTPVVAQWIVLDPATLDYAATQKHALRLQ